MSTPIAPKAAVSLPDNEKNRYEITENSLVQKLIRYQTEHQGYLTNELLFEFASKEKVPLYRLQELVSFFNTFRKKPLPKVHVQICRDFTCQMGGSRELLKLDNQFTDEIKTGLLEIEGKSCIAQCDGPCAVIINHKTYRNQTQETLTKEIQNHLADKPTPPVQQQLSEPNSWKINPYQLHDTATHYQMFREFVTSENPEDYATGIISKLKKAELGGKGGPGESTSKKWEQVRNNSAEREKCFVICNADESEPGTFKDRELLLHVPHLIVEGMLIAALVVGAERAVIFIRHEFQAQIERLNQCIDDAYKKGLCGTRILNTDFSCDVEVFVSPGNYICGELTALIEAMEDKRAQPRQRPPDPQIRGYQNYPTLVNNVETYAWVPSILKNGPQWYAIMGTNGCNGCRFTSISGDVKNPGVYEVPLGSTVGDLLEKAGGMKNGQELLAFAPSGPSGGFIPAKMPRDFFPDKFVEKYIKNVSPVFDILDLPLDNILFKEDLGKKLNLGAAHLFVGDKSDLIALVQSSTEFYRNESCGKCVPCRIGSEKLVEISQNNVNGGAIKFPDYFQDLAELMKQSSICGLGQVAMAPLVSYKKYFNKTGSS